MRKNFPEKKINPEREKFYLWIFKTFITFIYVGGGLKCGESALKCGQRKTYKGQSSLWVLGMEFRLGSKHLYSKATTPALLFIYYFIHSFIYLGVSLCLPRLALNSGSSHFILQKNWNYGAFTTLLVSFYFNKIWNKKKDKNTVL